MAGEVSREGQTGGAGEASELAALIRAIPDFPIPGILFRDITPLLQSPGALRRVVDLLAETYRDARLDGIAAIESRGFIFGAPLAVELGVGLVLVRKHGKLPSETLDQEYALEYGTATIELHRDAVPEGGRVLVVDDLLATGGTALATCRLIERAGGLVVGLAFLIELAALAGRERLAGYDINALITY